MASVWAVGALADVIRNLVEEFLDILAIAQLAALAVAVAIAVNSSTIGFDERAREHATMIAFGTRVRTILGIAIAEHVLIGVLGTCLGLVTGRLILQWLFEAVLPTTFPDIGFTLDLATGTVHAAVAAGVVAVGLAPLLGIRKLTGMNVPATLRVVEQAPAVDPIRQRVSRAAPGVSFPDRVSFPYSAAMHTRRAAAAVALGLLIASGCVDATRAPSADPSTPALPYRSHSPGPTSRAGEPAGSPSPSPSDTPTQTPPVGSTIELTIDPALEASLPERIGAMSLIRHSLATGEEPPPGFNADLGRALLQASGSADGPLSVAWSEPAPEFADSIYALTIVAIRIPRAEARDLRDLAAADHLLVPGVSGSVRLGDVGSRSMLIVGDAAVASSGDTLYVLTFPPYDELATAPPGAAPTPPFSEAEFFAALPATDPETALPRPTPRPLPSVPPGASPPPDPAAEALLPDRIRDVALAKLSGRGPALFTGEWIYIGLPAYAVSPQLGLDPATLSAAAGHPAGLSSFWIVATPLPGFDRRTILAAWFRSLLSNGWEVETIEAGGRVAVVYGNQAVHTVDGALYWMTYLDLGDSWGKPPPRPAFHDVVVDALKALP